MGRCDKRYVSGLLFLAKDEPFFEGIHRVRPHKGQIETAKRILQLLDGSALQGLPKQQVQDPYSFRCIPQVHGATKDVVDNIINVVETEINSVTDNPIVFHEENKIVSGGKFSWAATGFEPGFPGNSDGGDREYFLSVEHIC